MDRKENRWLYLFAAILVNISVGGAYAWSVFQAALLDANPTWVIGQTSMAYSLSLAMVPVAMILTGKFNDNGNIKKNILIGSVFFGAGLILSSLASSPQMLLLTYGLIGGLGIGAAYGAATSTAVKWFPDKRGLAGGLAAAGFAGGSIILAPIAKNLIADKGISSTFRILGIVLLVVLVICSFIIKEPEVAKKASTSNKTAVFEPGANSLGKKWNEMVREGKFWLLWAVYVLACVGGLMVIGHGANIANDYLLGDPVRIVMVVGLTNLVGRVLWGFISDKIGRYNSVLLMFIITAIGLALLFVNQSLGAWAGVIGLMAVASSFGGFLGTYPGITSENWGTANAGQNYGWMFTAYGVAAVVGPMLASNIREGSGSYTQAFLVSSIMAIGGFLLMFLFKNKHVNK